MAGDFFGLSGHVIDGQFHVMEVAGEGGFSVVYRGQHLTLREPIAIKCLKIQAKHSNPAVVQSFTQRFFDESRIMYRLSQGNLNVVRCIATNVTSAPIGGGTVPYMVLEWLEGISMAKEMKDRRAKKLGGRPLAEVIALFEPAALAIAYAHSQGVVHRDVKPGNLFMHNTHDGPRMKVLDFGMAKVLDPEAMGGLESAETLGGVMVLSPQYVTPEQLDKAYGPIGPWTDVYSFAMIIVEALIDKRARQADTFADLIVQIAKESNAPTPRNRGVRVSDAVERVFAKAFAQHPKNRYADMGVFWRELKEAAAKPIEDEDLKTQIDMPIDLKGTLAMTPSQAVPRTDLSKTMPLVSQRPSGVPAPRSIGAGTLPLSAMTPELSHAQAAASEAMLANGARDLLAVRPSVPIESRPRPNEPARAAAAQAPMRAPISAPIVKPEPKPKRAPKEAKRSGGSYFFLFLLTMFIVASLGASSLVLVRMLR